jgi:hypothetical protein
VPYGLIVTIAAIALVVVYVLLTEVACWLKALAVALLLCSFGWQYGVYLQAALGVSISLYFTYLKSRASG